MYLHIRVSVFLFFLYFPTNGRPADDVAKRTAKRRSDSLERRTSIFYGGRGGAVREARLAPVDVFESIFRNRTY